jgi:hypothetical protein
MPDLMTHLATTHVLRRAWEQTRGNDFTERQAALLYVGGCLPDLISRLPNIVTGFLFRSGLMHVDTAVKCGDMWPCFHAPLPTMLVAYLLVILLPDTGRAYNFCLIIIASGLHFLLDALQKTFGDTGTAWFFPLSFKTASLGIFWPDEAILSLPWLAALIVAWEIMRRHGRNVTRYD